MRYVIAVVVLVLVALGAFGFGYERGKSFGCSACMEVIRDLQSGE
jgi:hypothetical protein